MLVNDLHSRLNATEVARIVVPRTVDELAEAVAEAGRRRTCVAVAGGLHAMGGQQFAAGGTLVDTRSLRRVLSFDPDAGTVEVEAGIQWPELIDRLLADQRGVREPWTIRQKQTGADRFTIGGSVAVNGHGRGLALAPLAADVDSLRLVRPDGSVVRCDRHENAELFSLAAGGYGLFGAIATLTLRLTRRRKLERVVEVTEADGIPARFEERIADGFLYGDFQFATDPSSPDFLRRGVFSCYRPVDPERPIPDDQRALSVDDWRRLLVLAHTDKTRAFEEYARHYAATSGQLYWSDLHQLGTYVDGYHLELDRVLGAPHPATEMIGELYVPRPQLPEFLADAAAELRGRGTDVIYGTVRLIERDEDTFLPWARERYGCVIFNVHTPHTDDGIEATAAAFRALIDLAAGRGGSYFLTYHRWATREQVERCYPQMAEFLRRKREHDPAAVFQSEWHRHLCRLLDGPA